MSDITNIQVNCDSVNQTENINIKVLIKGDVSITIENKYVDTDAIDFIKNLNTQS